jgi:hypothetical protein
VQEYLFSFDTERGTFMARMTDEEADYWDEYYTKNPPSPGPNGTGFFTQRRKAARTLTIDNLTADWLLTKAIAAHKTPAEIISDMVQKEIAAAI